MYHKFALAASKHESEKSLPINAVIFDLDGTITSFNLDYKELRGEVRAYLIKIGIPTSTLKVNESIFEMLKTSELYLKNSSKTDLNIQQVKKEVYIITEKFELEAASTTNLLPGAYETLKILKAKELKIALCTMNSQKTANNILKRFKLTEFFDATVPRESTDEIKPNPNHLGISLKILEIPATEAIVVGDSTIDMQSAKELNVFAVGVTSGTSTKDQLINAGANYIITSITDLPVLIERINKEEITK
ncbi:MAG: HAD family hydrolase [Crenarchaeota archaeon]|nr:HAD family hydrolase [Thermoproteota archaeon]